MIGSITSFITKFKDFVDSTKEMLMFSGDGCRKRKAGEVEEDQVNYDFFLCDCLFFI